jgi:hypothetical protein
MTVQTHTLPDIKWQPTKAKGERHGSKVQRVVLHRWGVKFTDRPHERMSYNGVINEFLNRANQASAHFVFPGSAVPNEITQMVRYADYAWTEAAYNPTSVEIECADAIWLGMDNDGLEQLAHITGFLLHHFDLPPVWSHDRGFCRHGDLGVAGGDHPACPTTNTAFWKAFVRKTQAHYHAGGYRKVWGV